MQNFVALVATGLLALAGFSAADLPLDCQKAQVQTFGLAEKVFGTALVDVCNCCYNTTEKIHARGRQVIVRPSGIESDWLLKDRRVSIDVINCLARNRGGSYPTKLVDDKGRITRAGCAVNFKLRKLDKDIASGLSADILEVDVVKAGLPFFGGYICPFILGPPALVEAPIEPTLSCEIRYCYVDSFLDDPSKECHNKIGEVLARDPSCPPV